MITLAIVTLICVIGFVVGVRSRRVDSEQVFKDYQDRLNRKYIERVNKR